MNIIIICRETTDSLSVIFSFSKLISLYNIFHPTLINLISFTNSHYTNEPTKYNARNRMKQNKAFVSYYIANVILTGHA